MVMRAQPVCWLLMVDIKRYTTVSRQLDTDPLSLRVGTWLRLSRDAIESAGGVIDKFLGDAIFAYWKNNAEAPALVSRALHQLVEVQQRRDPDFRIVLHRAAATLEGGEGGADNLSGPEVICAFRLEKVCSARAATQSSAPLPRPRCPLPDCASRWAAIRSTASPARTKCSGSSPDLADRLCRCFRSALPGVKDAEIPSTHGKARTALFVRRLPLTARPFHLPPPHDRFLRALRSESRIVFLVVGAAQVEQQVRSRQLAAQARHPEPAPQAGPAEPRLPAPPVEPALRV
jgi:hypothetical protein